MVVVVVVVVWVRLCWGLGWWWGGAGRLHGAAAEGVQGAVVVVAVVVVVVVWVRLCWSLGWCWRGAGRLHAAAAEGAHGMVVVAWARLCWGLGCCWSGVLAWGWTTLRCSCSRCVGVGIGGRGWCGLGCVGIVGISGRGWTFSQRSSCRARAVCVQRLLLIGVRGRAL